MNREALDTPNLFLDETTLLAYPNMKEVKMERLYQLSQRVSMETIVDTAIGIKRLGRFIKKERESLTCIFKDRYRSSPLWCSTYRRGYRLSPSYHYDKGPLF